MVVFISTPFHGKTSEEIERKIDAYGAKIKEKYGANTIILHGYCPEDNGFYDDMKHPRLAYLASAIMAMADEVDAVWFSADWRDANGCCIEHEICVRYGIKILDD